MKGAIIGFCVGSLLALFVVSGCFASDIKSMTGSCSSLSDYCKCSFWVWTETDRNMGIYAKLGNEVYESKSFNAVADTTVIDQVVGKSSSSGVMSVDIVYSEGGNLLSGMSSCVPFVNPAAGDYWKIISLILGGIAALSLVIGSSLRW